MGAVMIVPSANDVITRPAWMGDQPCPDCTHRVRARIDPVIAAEKNSCTAMPAPKAGIFSSGVGRSVAAPRSWCRESTTKRPTSATMPAASRAQHHTGQPCRWPSSSG